MKPTLVQKYNVPGPRYTSYPTVPYWDENFKYNEWEKAFVTSCNNYKSEGVSLYIHLPFCESLCTFCGCYKRITKNHKMEQEYIEAVLKEWKLYCNLLKDKPYISEIHLGGGTPTFFTPKNLELLVNGIFALAQHKKNCEMSFEGHPNNTTREHLETLFNLGFRRVSFGVQDYSEKVQTAINRKQSFTAVSNVTQWAREIGYTSIGHDLIYGLPFQNLDDIVDTIEKTRILQPDRIAFYSYAHVPWIKGNGQRGFRDEDIPKDEEKRLLYEVGKRLLELNEYIEIGMDHFALASDSLYQASENQKLHRNFMGYSSSQTKVMIGLGVSAIGDSWTAFAQNVKNLEDYYQMLEWNKLPLFRGHILNSEDLIIRQHILNLMCRFETSWKDEALSFPQITEVLSQLTEMEKDSLLKINPSSIRVTNRGKAFIRNICMAFDLRMKRHKPETQLFSMTV